MPNMDEKVKLLLSFVYKTLTSQKYILVVRNITIDKSFLLEYNIGVMQILNVKGHR